MLLFAAGHWISDEETAEWGSGSVSIVVAIFKTSPQARRSTRVLKRLIASSCGNGKGRTNGAKPNLSVRDDGTDKNWSARDSSDLVGDTEAETTLAEGTEDGAAERGGVDIGGGENVGLRFLAIIGTGALAGPEGRLRFIPLSLAFLPELPPGPVFPCGATGGAIAASG